MNTSIDSLIPYTKELTLLYVEDEKVTRNAFHKTFNRIFGTVYTAENGQEGLDIFNKYDVDIIITDIMMPGMSGMQMSRQIKKIDQTIPIIVTTALMGNDFFMNSIEIGIDGYLLKPIDNILLIQTIQRIVNSIRAVKSLHEDSQYFRILTQSSIVSKSNLDGIITYVNENLCNISGYSANELIGKSHNIFRYPKNTPEMYKDMWETILSGEVWRGRVENVNKSGNTFLADTIIIPLKDKKGNILEFIAIRQDVTEYVHLKRKMQYDALKKEELQRINEAKESFLILFTHELKTPLNAIINFSKYLYTKVSKSETLEPIKTAKLLKSITANAHDMLDNVNNILDISKLQSNKLSYNKELFNLNKLILSLLEQFDSLINDKNIKVELFMSEEIEIYSDEYRVKQIISNLLSNAIKYGKDKINISLNRVKNEIVIAIEDNGKGIKDKESVFNLYEQGDLSMLRRESQGTGIGLYFVKLMCNNLDIKYKLEDSKQLGGTNFELSVGTNHKNKKA